MIYNIYDRRRRGNFSNIINEQKALLLVFQILSYLLGVTDSISAENFFSLVSLHTQIALSKSMLVLSYLCCAYDLLFPLFYYSFFRIENHFSDFMLHKLGFEEQIFLTKLAHLGLKFSNDCC